MGELEKYGNNEEMIYEQMARMVTEPEDRLEIKMTKRGKSAKLTKAEGTLTRLEQKNCIRIYGTLKKKIRKNEKD